MQTVQQMAEGFVLSYWRRISMYYFFCLCGLCSLNLYYTSHNPLVCRIQLLYFKAHLKI